MAPSIIDVSRDIEFLRLDRMRYHLTVSGHPDDEYNGAYALNPPWFGDDPVYKSSNGKYLYYGCVPDAWCLDDRDQR